MKFIWTMFVVKIHLSLLDQYVKYFFMILKHLCTYVAVLNFPQTFELPQILLKILIEIVTSLRSKLDISLKLPFVCVTGFVAVLIEIVKFYGL